MMTMMKMETKTPIMIKVTIMPMIIKHNNTKPTTTIKKRVRFGAAQRGVPRFPQASDIIGQLAPRRLFIPGGVELSYESPP